MGMTFVDHAPFVTWPANLGASPAQTDHMSIFLFRL